MSQTIAVPRLAASLILLRDGPASLEVMMVERTGSASYAAGKFVFPGGTVDAEDTALAAAADLAGSAADLPDGGLRVAAIRETYEECGLLLTDPEPETIPEGSEFAVLVQENRLRLPLQRLVPFAHWITPPHLPKRFDTHFFVAAAPARQSATADRREVVSAAWLHPAEVVAAAGAGDLNLMFATYMNLCWLAQHASVAAALDAAQARQIVTVIPKPRDVPEGKLFCIPPEAGYPHSEVLESRFRRA